MMKPTNRSNQTVSILIFSLVLLGCSRDQPATKNAGVKPPVIAPVAAEVSLKQNESDLLAGISHAVAYSGFRAGQHPDRGDGANNPSDEEILEDLNLLARDGNFRLIRLYDSGENSEAVLKLIAENNIDIKVMLGMWLSAELSNHVGCSWLTEPIPDEKLAENKTLNKKEIENGIRLAKAYPEIVVAVNVGNEALVEWTDHIVPTETVIGYVKQVKEAIEQPVSVAENYKWWADHGTTLAAEVDFISVHIYPVWENKDIDLGLSYSLKNLQDVRSSLPDSRIVISEAGWASEADNFGARASEEKQLQYYNELMSWAADQNITTFFFEAFDEDWKGDPDNALGAEKHWGLFTIDRKPKKVMQEKYPDLK